MTDASAPEGLTKVFARPAIDAFGMSGLQDRSSRQPPRERQVGDELGEGALLAASPSRRSR